MLGNHGCRSKDLPARRTSVSARGDEKRSNDKGALVVASEAKRRPRSPSRGREGQVMLEVELRVHTVGSASNEGPAVGNRSVLVGECRIVGGPRFNDDP